MAIRKKIPDEIYQNATTHKKENGQQTQNKTEELQRWTEWIHQQFYKTEALTKLNIAHIEEAQWEQLEQKTKEEINTTQDLKLIRENAELTKLLKEYPYIQPWIEEDYTNTDIRKAIVKLKNQKSHGSDGIPGEVYKAIKQWVTKDICKILNRIKHGHKIPETWTQGSIVKIYKQKGDKQDCSSYRPICLTQVVYKIWSQLLTNKLAKILHIITGKHTIRIQKSTINDRSNTKNRRTHGKSKPWRSNTINGPNKSV